MKSVSLIGAFVLCLIIFSGLSASAFERCIMCGMDADKSETKFIIEITKGTGEIAAGRYSLCCLHCFVLLKEHLKKGRIGDILVRDYNTVTDEYDSGEMVDAEKASYLVEGSVRPKGSMVPFMLVFASGQTAENFQKAYGGRVLNWEEVLKYTEGYK